MRVGTVGPRPDSRSGRRTPTSPAGDDRDLNLRRLLLWSIVAVVLLFVVQSPGHAAEVVRDAGGGLMSVASSLASFFASLV